MVTDFIMEATDSQLIDAVLSGEINAFETLVSRYQPRIFATARRYSRSENDVEDIVQEIFIKAFTKLGSFRAEAPFEHWLMRLSVRTCYDYLRKQKKSRETTVTSLSADETNWLESFVSDPNTVDVTADGARRLVARLMKMLSAPARMVIQLQEIDGKSIKEIAALTGWSISLVKVRAFRARKEMQKCLAKITLEKYL